MKPTLPRGTGIVLVYAVAGIGLALLGDPLLRAIASDDAELARLQGYAPLLLVAITAPLLLVLLLLGDRGQRRVLQGLQAARAVDRELFDHASDSLLVHEASGRIVDVNERALRTYGYDRRGFLQADLASLSSGEPPYSIKEARSWLKKALAGEEPCFEWHARAKDGRLFWVEARLRRVQLHGQPHVLASIRTVGERRHAGAAGDENEQRFRNVFERTPKIAVHGYDAKRRAMFWNSACEQLYGIAAKDAMGRKLEELIVPEAMRRKLVRDIDGWLHGGPPAPPAEQHRRHRDGREVHVYSSHVLLRNAHDEPELYCIDIDLSAQEQALVAVKGREHAMQLAAEAALELLRDRDTDAAINAVLERIGRGLQVDRVYIVELHGAPDGVSTLSSRRFEWSREGVVPAIDLPETQNLPMDSHLPNWLGELLEGRSVGGHVDEVPYPERSMLEMHSVQSVFAVPIMLDHRPWGFLGCDAVLERRLSGQADESVLHIVGACLAAAIERRRAEEKLRQNAKVFESTRDGVMVTDLRGNIVAVNAAFCDISGYGESDVLGRNPRMLQSGRQDRAFFAEMWETLLNRGHWQGEVWNRRKGGEVYPQWLNVSTVVDDRGQPSHYVGVGTDISQLKRSEQQLQHLAHHDPLTELPNRLLAQSRLEHALDRARRNDSRIGVIFVDLDGFKHVNDSLGHPIGDRLLVAIANRLRPRVRSSDTLARLGGDEFLVIVENLNETNDAAGIARKLISSLDQPFMLEGREVFISASIGISVYPDDGLDGAELIRNADTAMYQAKSAGRNQACFYTSDMNANALAQLEMDATIRNALQNGGFELHFQPKYDLHQQRVTGFEALVRMRGNDGNLVPPDRFVPLAERSGLIVPIGTWVLQQACAAASAWRERGHPAVNIAVNVSARQFRSDEFHNEVQRALLQSGLPSGALELELTETMLMDDPHAMVDRLTALKKIGVKLSLDDFGTGYSSLGYLLRFPIDALKIDKSFVSNLGSDEHASDIITSIIDLARRMHLRVVAEGVETIKQAAFLRDQDCNEVQGYLLSRPLPAAQVQAFLDRHPSLALEQRATKAML